MKNKIDINMIDSELFMPLVVVMAIYMLLILVVVIWFVKVVVRNELAIKKATVVHDCNKFLVCDEKHPDFPFKCQVCAERY
ncbi:MAG: hypothetical protein BM557_09630 [Flavobacterium sp. MedPE-SWcel]|uniref:hypothetical protein n=1 Tax=uncultured Flavobacterium sp. TaxID=165435 RepID=UPI00091DF414|nr:hypothetical protein [uncultured Flavobacterium sp.]OIQ16564.1 MAG: hypothetical protein BM557_09630 [Flavobacterium sp. MedPE-SWcel]